MPLPTMRVYHMANGGEHEIWLDAGMNIGAGVCIGVGDSREEATDDAIGELRAALVRLGAPMKEMD
jgi:hypothetical protein